MDLLMNGLLFAATLFAGGYCWVLSRRVRDLKSLDKGLGGSIVTLTRQIELARLTLEEAKSATKDRRQDLAQLVAKAEAAAGQLRMLLAVVPPAPAAPAHAPEPELRASREMPPVAAEVPAAPVLRAVPDAPLAEPESHSAAAPQSAPAPHAVAEVPKPRVLAPVENPLRRARGASPAPASPAPTSAVTPSEEADILEALSALAGAGAR